MTAAVNAPMASAKTIHRIEEVARYNIKRYMRLTGVTQGDLSRATGISRPSISQMLSGDFRLKFAYIAIAADVLGVSLNDLMDDTYIRQDEEFMAKMRDNATSTRNTPAEREDPASLAGAGSKRYVLDFDESGKKGTDQRA